MIVKFSVRKDEPGSATRKDVAVNLMDQGFMVRCRAMFGKNKFLYVRGASIVPSEENVT